MYIGLDSDQKHFFPHADSNSCDTFRRVATQAVALGQRRFVRKSPEFRLLLQSYKRPEPAPMPFAFALRYFRRRESVKTDPNAMWLVSPDVRSTYSEDGAVLLDIRKGLCYSLNPVAARVWSTVEASPSGVDLRGLVDVMETHYTISREQLERDVDEYLSKLENIGLVQRNGVFHESKAASARG